MKRRHGIMTPVRRILFYTDTPLLGGTEQQMYLLAKFLPREKFEISLACPSSASLNGWCQKFIELGSEVIRLHVLHKHDPRHYFYLKKILPRFDLLHAHLWNPASCRWALLAARNLPVIVTEHDPFPLSGFKKKIKSMLSGKIQKVILCSRSAEEVMESAFPWARGKIIMVPNGIDIEAWRAAAVAGSSQEIRKEIFGTKGGEKVVLCVAELNARKGQRFLIEAAAEVKKRHSLRVVLVGDGPERYAYRTLAKRLGVEVVFLGRREDVAELMAAADVFVLPSVREAFGLVILEAAVAGVPIVASAVGGIQELIRNGKEGILVEPQNPHLLARSISDVMENSFDSRKFAVQARQRVEEFFSAKRMADKTADLYDEVLNNQML